MEVRHCKAQHEVLVTFIRYTLHFWGPWDQLPLSYWSDPETNRANNLSPTRVPSALKVVLTRARVLSEECCSELPPLQAALLHAKRSQAFTDILKEIQWCVSVVLHGRICRHVMTSRDPELKKFPWDAKVGQQEQVLMNEAEQKDWQDLMLLLKGWAEHHSCTGQDCGNVHGRSNPLFCLATQLNRYWSGEGSSSYGSDHLSLLWSFDEESVNRGRLLGSGSFGAVTQSKWLTIECAQKIFSSHGMTSLQAEAEALAKLNHPHIVNVYACSEKSLLLDLMSVDLHQFIEARMEGGARNQPFSLRAAMDLMLQIADAVSYLHSQGMVHRDLKSSNILVDPVKMPGVDLEDEYVFAKITDFGLAKVKNEMTRYSHCTHNIGTRRWMAPEIFRANIDGDHLESAYPMKADVYSFGLICFEILSGKEPYNDVQMSSLYSELTRPFPLRPQLPSNCPTALHSLICSCWDADPRERPTFIDVCQVLRYLNGVKMLAEFKDLTWNPIDGIWPFGRLITWVEAHAQAPTVISYGSLSRSLFGTRLPYDIKCVKFHFVNSTVEMLIGITLACSKGGQLVEKLVGRDNGITSDWIKFDHPSEYLVQVEYSYCEVGMHSLSLITTKQKYGPYGRSCRQGSRFLFSRQDSHFSTTPGRVVGFRWYSTSSGNGPLENHSQLLIIYTTQDIVECLCHFKKA